MLGVKMVVYGWRMERWKERHDREKGETYGKERSGWVIGVKVNLV